MLRPRVTHAHTQPVAGTHAPTHPMLAPRSHQPARSPPDRAPRTPYRAPPLHATLTTFSVAPPGPGDSDDDVLDCPTLRSKLTPRPSPFCLHNNFGGGFVDDGDRVALSSLKFASSESAGASCLGAPGGLPDAETDLFNAGLDVVCVPLAPWAYRAGARETIYHTPATATAAIVTCGGLCPGLNDVIAGLVSKLHDYGVSPDRILGIRNGLKGFYARDKKPITLSRDAVDGIQLQGGTILGTSRGGADVPKIVSRISQLAIDMVFVVGGNGGNAAAAAIAAECDARGVVCSVVGVPKSIDNDILLIDRCFGFDTAVEESQRALLAAKVEASSAYRGIGIVRLMGRQSGFIALQVRLATNGAAVGGLLAGWWPCRWCGEWRGDHHGGIFSSCLSQPTQASLASGVVDVCLIPEVPFALDGGRGLAAFLRKKLAERGHAVLCVAEGAGQDLLGTAGGTDASGNPLLADSGAWLKNQLKSRIPDADIKYIDPSYMIRATPTIAADRVYCKILSHNAVHAAFAGYTGITVGMCSGHHCYLPIPVIIQAPRRVDPRGKQWNRLKAAIGQPSFVDGDDEGDGRF